MCYKGRWARGSFAGRRRPIGGPISMATLATDAVAVAVRHPLEPLSVDEIAAVVQILRSQRRTELGPRVRFVNITLHEPPKAVVLAFEATGSAEREAFVI